MPADNPFVGRKGVVPETWMWGLRNPWRFSFDRATGDLWIGDVGQDKYEEIDYAPRGREGHQLGLERARGLPRVQGRARRRGARDPIVEAPHSDGYCAIVGGYVYRGRAIPALDGVYLFGDDCRAEPRRRRAARRARRSRSATSGSDVPQLTTFGEDGTGELYAVAHAAAPFYRLIAG